MNKLDLCPLQSSYSVKYGTSVERIALRGGFGRYVQTKNAKKHLVDLAFTLREDDFIYFRAFYLNWQLNPLPFLMSLIIEDSEFREYIAQFVPDSFNFNELNGSVFSVSAQVVVVTTEVQVLTSKLYPIEADDELLISDYNIETFTKSNLVQQTEASELFGSSFAIQKYVLYDPLTALKAENEQISTSFLINSAYLRVESMPVKRLDENFATTFTANNFYKKQILITNTAETQSVNSTFSVTSFQFK
ncbi:hypothetical protein HI850_007640 [bacterium SPL81]|nr:hypothetical protein [Acinetobacter baumannii]